MTIERDRAAGLAPVGPPSAQLLARSLHACRNELLADPLPGEALVDELVALTLRLLYARL